MQGKLREKQRQIAAEGLPVEGASARVTIATWAKTWTERRQHEVRSSTMSNDVSQVRRWVVPTIGHVRLEQLTPAHMRAVTAAILSAGRAQSSALRAQVVLKKMLRDAIVEGYRVPQRILQMPNPEKNVTDRDAVPLIDAHAIIRAAGNLGPEGSRWVAAFLQGMRQGECLGLTWDCVDFERKTIDVAWQLDAVPYRIPRDRSSGFRIKPGTPHRHLMGRWHLVPPKSKSGTRVIPMVPWMEAALRAWREAAPASPHRLVWPAPDGSPRDDKDDSLAWYALQDVAQVARVDEAPHTSGLRLDERGGPLVGRRYALHEARHSTATLLMEAGVSNTVITAIMGHSSIVSSQAYLHASREMTHQALDGVAGRLGLNA
ncbi:tyrosine-type recombinase/integrase [Oerskovia jenensis]|uniref:Integrase n=1 Tax=Oerskovia jenensis TaxID=162169 RepID=A0ABS2LJ54_9CELL|nr:site-specific integrase [Oerskovia jenensis]MBM7480169.1 integrase [Oerskovia jenensis]